MFINFRIFINSFNIYLFNYNGEIMSENKPKPRKPVKETVEKSFDKSNRPKQIIKIKR